MCDAAYFEGPSSESGFAHRLYPVCFPTNRSGWKTFTCRRTPVSLKTSHQPFLVHLPDGSVQRQHHFKQFFQLVGGLPEPTRKKTCHRPETLDVEKRCNNSLGQLGKTLKISYKLAGRLRQSGKPIGQAPKSSSFQLHIQIVHL